MMMEKDTSFSDFTMSDMEFLHHPRNEDSLELSLSDEDDDEEEDDKLREGIKSGEYLSSESSEGDSEWSPSSFSNTDFELSCELLADVPLPSLGEKKDAKKLLSRLLDEDLDFEKHQYFPSTYLQYPLQALSATKEGHAALQTLHNDIKRAREKNSALQTEISHLKSSQLSSRDDLYDLDIGEELFHKLSKMSTNDITLREFACLRAATIYVPLRQKVQKLERTVYELEVSLERSNALVESQSAELSRHRKLSSTTQESYRLDLMAAEERAENLKARLDIEIAKRQERENQAARCDDAVADAEAMRKEASILRNTVEEQSKMLESVTANEQNNKQILADATKAKEMLEMDKAYLQRELGDVVASSHEQARKIESQQAIIEKLEAKVLDMTDQLVSVQQTTRTAFDERMEKEISRLRSDYDKDLNSIKDSSKEIITNENRVLREVRQSLEREVDELRRRLDDKDNKIHSLTKELADNRSATDSEISQLRAEVKMKAFEVSSLGATFEERSSQLKLAQLDVDALREEVSVHKAALLKMENETENKCNRLENDLARAYETIHAYDVLFSDNTQGDQEKMLSEKYQNKKFDDTCDLSEVEYKSDEDWEEQGEDNGSGQGGNSVKTFLNKKSMHAADTISKHHKAPLSLSILVSNPRKFRHLLDTAERNVRTIDQLNRRIEELNFEKNAMTKDISKLKDDLSKKTRMLELVPKSSKQILDLHSQKDDECRMLYTKINTYENKTEQLQKEVKSYEAENSSLKQKLRAVIEERQELEELKNLLLEYRNQARDSVSVQETDVLTSQQSFSEDQLNSPVYRSFAQEDYHSPQVEGSNRSAAKALPSLLEESEESKHPSPVATRTPQYQRRGQAGVSSPSTPAQQRAIKGISPDVLRSMVERDPSNSPVRSQSGSAKKIAFHVRSPVGS